MLFKTQNNRLCGKDFDSSLVLVGSIFINILFITIFRMTNLFAQRNAVLLFQVIFAVVCNGHPVDQIFTTGKIVHPSISTSVSEFNSHFT